MADIKPFRVEGEFKMGKKTATFSVETVGKDALAARERVVSTLGSKHRVDRHHLKINAVTEIATADVTDPVVKHLIETGA